MQDGTREQTFLFADLAGYTALTEAHGDEHAAEVVGDVCERVRALLDRHAARVVNAASEHEILVTAATRDAAAPALADLEFVHAGVRRLKNVSAPVEVY